MFYDVLQIENNFRLSEHCFKSLLLWTECVVCWICYNDRLSNRSLVTGGRIKSRVCCWSSWSPTFESR